MIHHHLSYVQVAKADCKSVYPWSGTLFDDTFYPVRLKIRCDRGRVIHLDILKEPA